ncbi:putative deoxyribonuclease TATDN3 isoform X1 [Rhopilema esculentum]|uniref:putative deoxyribonuclease TATDN3 isoform X1 n=1 Tax=Rhopilema esculentum TaxID=499914 RepID=UPI0031DAA1B8
MIDVHCHISAEEFASDRELMIQGAQEVGVKAIVAVCEFPKDFSIVLELSTRYPGFIHPCVGAHPVQEGNRSVSLKEFEKTEEFVRQNAKLLVGIGEVGLDFTPYIIKSPKDKEIQREVFKRQIQLAKDFSLPLNVHSRSAGRPVIDILIQEGAKDVVLHAFDGKPSVAMKGVDAGYFFSVPPSVIRSEQKQRLIKQIPLANLLLETDAPALGPVKQERNEPKNIEISCREISKIKNISVAHVIEETTKNALRLFDRLSR